VSEERESERERETSIVGPWIVFKAMKLSKSVALARRIEIGIWW